MLPLSRKDLVRCWGWFKVQVRFVMVSNCYGWGVSRKRMRVNVLSCRDE